MTKLNPNTNEPLTTINILKIATCGKVTLPDDQTLTYNIGYDTADKSLLIRITDNATGGLFSPEWIPLNAILTTINTRPNPETSFNARIFTGLYTSASANNAGFLVAALKAEGILVSFKQSTRLHEMGAVEAFEKSIRALIKDNVSLHDVVAERAAARAKVQAANAKKLASSRAKTAVNRTPTK
jgi:hypothetical protein